MADKKISGLTSASVPLAGTEVLPIVQSNTTVKVASNDLTVKNVRSNATTGILQIAGPTAAATRTMTVPDANFTVARTDASNTFTGAQTINSNVGLNAATKSWSGGYNSLDINGYASYSGTTGITLMSGNAYNDGANWRYNANGAATYYYQSGGTHVWARGASGTAGGNVSFINVLTTDTSGNVSVSNGNLVVGTAGKGVDFSANTGAPGMTSELLNWYEEGTWTPAITCGVPGDLTVAYSSQAGFYTRIGRTVNVTFLLTTSTFTRSTASGLLIVSGLPFAIPNTSNLLYYGAMSAQGISRANYTQLACVGLTNSSNIIFPAMAIGTNQNILNIEITDLPSGGAVILRGSLTYSV